MVVSFSWVSVHDLSKYFFTNRPASNLAQGEPVKRAARNLSEAQVQLF